MSVRPRAKSAPPPAVPSVRRFDANQAPLRPEGDFVLYWMIAQRRTEWNFALQRAVEWANELGKPLVILEALRVGYKWASDRFHRFVIDGMVDNARRIASLRHKGVVYYPYVEPHPDAGKGLLEALADRACLVVTDDFPCFFLPRMVSVAAAKLPVRLELVDGNGLLPLRATDRVFNTALSFRRFLQQELPAHLGDSPRPDPLKDIHWPDPPALPEAITRRWPPAGKSPLAGSEVALATLPIDHSVAVVDQCGGAESARRKLLAFVYLDLARYAELANQPDNNVRSGLSPYLHFGHISAHELFHEMVRREHWTIEELKKRPTGKREGFWGMRAGAESWLDQFLTWRELGYNMAAHNADYDQYESLPAWARTTLERHARDRREYVYSLDELREARTHDPLWNAAQRQLLREGRIHNYLRMLWGKKILEWTAHPRDALEVMIELNNRYALDGRDPNSYSGIFWVLGRYDRPWGPERPVFGTVRYMSSENTRRKLRIRTYLAKYFGI